MTYNPNIIIFYVDDVDLTRFIFFLAVDCRDPGTIDNGRVIVMNDSTTYNGAAEYHCVPGYERVGPYLRKCMEDATWSGEQPICQR